MADEIWSDDGDLYLKDHLVLECFPRAAKCLVEAADGATDATGKVLTSAAVASTFVSAGVGEDSEDNACVHFLEISAGEYQGFYKIVTVAVNSLTVDRVIKADATSLKFRVRSFADWHDEAHLYYQDWIKRLESDEDWEDSELHARAKRLLRDVCVARVLKTAFESASRTADDVYERRAKRWASREARWFTTLGRLEKDTDADGEADGKTDENIGGSIQIGVS